MKNILSILLILIFICQFYAQKSDFNHIDFKKADSIVLAFKNEGLENLPELAHKLTTNLNSDVEKFRAIYLWVSSNIANDYGLYLKHKRKRYRFKDDSLKLMHWNEDVKKIIIRKLLKNQKTICTGYAYLVKELSNFAGLECEIIHGFGRTSTIDVEKLHLPNHSWNAVKLGDKWYLSDATWGSGVPNPSTFKFNFQYNDGFFLAEPKLFAVNHLPVEPRWTLLDEEKEKSLLEFIESPIIYGKAYEYLKTVNSPKFIYNVISPNESIVFEYHLLQPLEESDLSLSIVRGENSHVVHPKTTLDDNLILKLEHQFKREGVYDVHLLIKDELISTYTIEVTSKENMN